MAPDVSLGLRDQGSSAVSGPGVLDCIYPVDFLFHERMPLTDSLHSLIVIVLPILLTAVTGVIGGDIREGLTFKPTDPLYRYANGDPGHCTRLTQQVT